MLKATQKLIVDIEEAEEDIPLHGMINDDEARHTEKAWTRSSRTWQQI